jgi:hypothetical protein
MDGLQDNQSTWVKVTNNHLVEATSKEVGPTTWVCFTRHPQGNGRDEESISFPPRDYVAPQWID